MASTIYRVAGMTCDHCVNAVRSEIERVQGVSDIRVELASGLVTVVADRPLDDAAIRAAVDEAGYEVVST